MIIRYYDVCITYVSCVTNHSKMRKAFIQNKGEDGTIKVGNVDTDDTTQTSFTTTLHSPSFIRHHGAPDSQRIGDSPDSVRASVWTYVLFACLLSASADMPQDHPRCTSSRYFGRCFYMKQLLLWCTPHHNYLCTFFLNAQGEGLIISFMCALSPLPYLWPFRIRI